MTQQITAKNFEETIEKQGIVVLDFWAEWCGPCKTFAPVFQAAAERHPEVTWGKIDIAEEEGLAAALEIKSIPTLMVFRDGIMLFRQAGVVPGATLEELVEKIGALDMADVKRKLEEHEAAHARGECNHDHGHEH